MRRMTTRFRRRSGRRRQPAEPGGGVQCCQYSASSKLITQLSQAARPAAWFSRAVGAPPASGHRPRPHTPARPRPHRGAPYPPPPGAPRAGYGRLRHISTFGGHPVGCAIAPANIDIIEPEGLVDRSRHLGRRFRDLLAPLADLAHVGQVRGRGLLAGVELVED